MEITIRADSVEISGYVNAIERNSKPLKSRFGYFIERICKGAFLSSLKRNDDVHILLNHEWSRDLGSTKSNLELEEDSIGLHARATISDPEVIEKAKAGKLVGWSFGFYDVPEGVEERTEGEQALRLVKDLDLREVSILDDNHSPAYEGTLIQSRDDKALYMSQPFVTGMHIRDLSPEKPEDKKEIDYSKFEKMIREMKGEN